MVCFNSNVSEHYFKALNFPWRFSSLKIFSIVINHDRAFLEFKKAPTQSGVSTEKRRKKLQKMFLEESNTFQFLCLVNSLGV